MVISLAELVFLALCDYCRAIWLQDQSIFLQESVGVYGQF